MRPTIEARSIQLIATTTGAFVLPLMLTVSRNTGDTPHRQLFTVCLATIIGGAVGFSCFIPRESLAKHGSLMRKILCGTAIGIVIGACWLARNGVPPISWATAECLVVCAGVGALGAWLLSLKDDLVGQPGQETMLSNLGQTLFRNGYMSAAVWTAMFLIGGIVYTLVDASCKDDEGTMAQTRNLIHSVMDGSLQQLASASLTMQPTKNSTEPSAFGWQTANVNTAGAKKRNDRFFEEKSVPAQPSTPSVVAPSAADIVAVTVDDSVSASDDVEVPPALTTEVHAPSTDVPLQTISEMIAALDSQHSRKEAADRLDNVACDSSEGRTHRKPIAKAFKRLAFDHDHPNTQITGVKGMVRWGGKHSIRYLRTLRTETDRPELSTAIDAALAQFDLQADANRKKSGLSDYSSTTRLTMSASK